MSQESKINNQNWKVKLFKLHCGKGNYILCSVPGFIQIILAIVVNHLGIPWVEKKCTVYYELPYHILK